MQSNSLSSDTMNYSTWLSFTRKTVYDAKRRAKINGLPFYLNLYNVRELFPYTQKTCPCCGVEFKGKGKMAPNSPTLDRIYPHKGYVVGNMQVICNDCNLAKGNVESYSELLARAGKLLNMAKMLWDTHYNSACQSESSES